MKITLNSPNFKGYDALPLKALHIEESTSAGIMDELKEIAQQENFELRQGLDYYRWTQDLKMIVEKDKKPFLIVNDRVEDTYLEEMKIKYGISGKKNEFIATGGNTFIGKFPNGEKWMMVGYDELATKSYKYLSQEYGIKEENIIPIPQQNYHLDMFMRPIGYPYVLVNNPELVREKIKELNKDGKYDELEQAFLKKEQERQMEYSSYKKTIKALKKAGFEPIEVAGVFGSGINFMNAIVNQHSNGKMTYITNGTMSLNGKKNIFQEIFEQELRQKAPDIEKVYFINGALDSDSNFLMNELERFDGGLHCMTTEEPNFRMWV